MLDTSNVFLTGVVLEALSQWSSRLKAFQQKLGKHFARSEARLAAYDYIQALLSPVERKNGWQMAEQVGYSNPYRFQHLLGRAQWNADAVCAEIRKYAVEHLKSETDILAIDETGFLKQGEQSVGVQVQYYGTTGHLENCQVGVFMSYISDKGHTLIDRRLYLPRTWSEDQSKRKKGAVPKSITFATKPQLAQQMLESAFKDGIRPAWFVADEVYGNDGSLWWWLEKTAKQPYILTVSKKQPVVIGWQRYQAQELLPQPDSQLWQRLSCGAGSKGERYYDWAKVPVNCDRSDGFQRWLLFRRSLEHPEDPRVSYYQVFAKSDTTLETMVQIAGQRWRIEECFKFAKDQLGLGEYEVRSWHGWHRHITLVLAAQIFLTVLRHSCEPAIHSSTPPLPLVTTGSLTAFKAARGLLSD
ncbi:MAG: IS701 family transposase ISCARN75 [Chroococcidiopsis sp. SAG 2025]|uniref:IS701 family transposase n=1 Tax=Chroococcidiopsis sp. SAG 2025 TaxID=171389 RepID=UPI0029371217|nr:IS701 family transposase [Chroococcidiopsis sp. SAG 2025]MDV2993588.1 IS701 family transposase ISCARN75 [Chroococcidiopsis sp. SAG 2025]MDV2994727.1 IS701 family transposase ISCARN75 [Chroococcidiopsis sp. SAG 2025]